MRADSILQTIGNTPHVRVNRLFGPEAQVWMKSGRSNPGGSIKDRIGLAMIEAAEKSGHLTAGATIIEPTSGNTGVGLAMVAAVKGYKLILVMPDSMSIERRRLMLAYGASFDLTPREKGMKGAIARAQELAAATPNSWVPQQFDNPANIEVHVRTTALEILADFPDGLDAIITGVGTGGHLSGVAQVLKAKWPQLKVFAVEPTQSPVISGGAPAPHPIQGIGAGFIPKNLLVDLLDGVILVDAEPAREMARRSAREEGMLVGISSGATLAAIAHKLPELPANAKVLGFNSDTGERYFSVDGFLPTERVCSLSFRSADDGQLGDAQRQPLHAVAREVDLGSGVVANAFEHQDLAFTKLGVKDVDTRFKAVRRRFALGRHGWVGEALGRSARTPCARGIGFGRPVAARTRAT